MYEWRNVCSHNVEIEARTICSELDYNNGGKRTTNQFSSLMRVFKYVGENIFFSEAVNDLNIIYCEYTVDTIHNLQGCIADSNNDCDQILGVICSKLCANLESRQRI